MSDTEELDPEFIGHLWSVMLRGPNINANGVQGAGVLIPRGDSLYHRHLKIGDKLYPRLPMSMESYHTCYLVGDSIAVVNKHEDSRRILRTFLLQDGDWLDITHEGGPELVILATGV